LEMLKADGICTVEGSFIAWRRWGARAPGQKRKGQAIEHCDWWTLRLAIEMRKLMRKLPKDAKCSDALLKGFLCSTITKMS
jgi:hypothetical protein